MRHLGSALLVLCAMALVGGAQAQTYNVQDFSATSNPNGVWSYGSIPSLGGTFTLLTKKITIQDNYYNLAHWMLTDTSPYYPAVVGNLSGATNTTWAINPFPAGAVGIHPSILSDMGVIRFTSPANATYDLDFLFDGLGRATVDVYVYHGTTQLFSGNLNQNGGGNTASFVTTRFIGLGQTLDLIVGHGNDRGDLTHWYDGTRVSGTITRVGLGIDNLPGQSLPEPGALALLVGAGIAASLVALRRRGA